LALRVYNSSHALQIVTLASQIDLDLFILFLNNIVFPEGNMSPKKWLKQAIQFIA